MASQFIYKHKYLFTAWLVSIVIGFTWLLLHQKGEIILLLNEQYNASSVSFFSFFSYVGEWMGFVFPLIYLVSFKSIRTQIGFLMVGVLTLALVGFFKFIVFFTLNSKPLIWNIKLRKISRV